MTNFILWKQWNIIKSALCKPVCNTRSMKYMQPDHWFICPRIPSPTMTTSSFLGNSTRSAEEYFFSRIFLRKFWFREILSVLTWTVLDYFFFPWICLFAFLISSKWMAFNILWQIIIKMMIIIIVIIIFLELRCVLWKKIGPFVLNFQSHWDSLHLMSCVFLY